MTQQQQPQPLPHIDVPDIQEMFVDFVRQMHCNGATVRLEFAVTRFDEAKPGTPQTGRSYTTNRMVMPLDGFLQWHAQAGILIANLEAQGAIKRNPLDQVTSQPKH